MRDFDLSQQLKQLAVDHQEENAQINAQLETLDHRRHMIQQQLLTLQAELDELANTRADLVANTEAGDEHYAAQVVELCLASLSATNSRLETLMVDSRNRNELIAQRAELLAGATDLVQDWRDYQAFEADKQSALACLPEYYRNNLLASHEQLRMRVQPLLDIEFALAQFTETDAADIDCLLFHQPDTADVAIVLPIQKDAATDRNTYGAQWNSLIVQVSDAFFELGKSPDWQLIEMTSDTWFNYVAISMLAEYTGHLPIERACSLAIEQHSSRNPPVAGRTPKFHLTPVSLATWQAGRNEAREDSLGVLSETQTEMEEVDVIEPGEDSTPTATEMLRVDGWYTPADVRSWRQSIKVTSDSKWSRSARIIRTMLIRMIGKGYIGSNSVTVSQLWSALPQEPANTIRQTVGRLIINGLLLAQETSDAQLVAISPDFLEEVQNLITRTVSPFWEQMLAIGNDGEAPVIRQEA